MLKSINEYSPIEDTGEVRKGESKLTSGTLVSYVHQEATTQLYINVQTKTVKYKYSMR